MSVCVHPKIKSVDLVVSDRENNTLTLLKKLRQARSSLLVSLNKDPRGVASDMTGNICMLLLGE